MAPNPVKFPLVMKNKRAILNGLGAFLLILILAGLTALALWAWHDNISAPPYSPAYSPSPAQPAPVPESPYHLVAIYTGEWQQAEWLCFEVPDRLWVGSSDGAVGLDLSGRIQARLRVPAGTRALAADPTPGVYYAALTDRVVRISGQGAQRTEWVSPGQRALLTALACDGKFVYAADAGQRVVWQYDQSTGALAARLGLRDPDRDIPGFIIPSPYFSIAMAPDGLLRVVNPGRHSIEAYTAEGHLETRWGRASWDIDGFVGCCNPSYLAVMGDGRFVTSEKGIRRIKVYDAQGRFEAVVATADQLRAESSAAGGTIEPCPIAVKPQATADGVDDRIWVLIPRTGILQVYARTPTAKTGGGERP